MIDASTALLLLLGLTFWAGAVTATGIILLVKQ